MKVRNKAVCHEITYVFLYMCNYSKVSRILNQAVVAVLPYC
jgi:hypothetical protein